MFGRDFMPKKVRKVHEKALAQHLSFTGWLVDQETRELGE